MSIVKCTPGKSVRAVAAASAPSDSAYGEGPRFVSFEVTEALLSRIEELKGLCQRHDLSEARITFYPDWGPGNVEEELLLENGELVVVKSGYFWFTDYPKHGAYDIESSGKDLADLRVAFDEAANGAEIFLTDRQDIRDMYLEDREAMAQA